MGRTHPATESSSAPQVPIWTAFPPTGAEARSAPAELGRLAEGGSSLDTVQSTGKSWSQAQLWAAGQGTGGASSSASHQATVMLSHIGKAPKIILCFAPSTNIVICALWPHWGCARGVYLAVLPPSPESLWALSSWSLGGMTVRCLPGLSLTLHRNDRLSHTRWRPACVSRWPGLFVECSSVGALALEAQSSPWEGLGQVAERESGKGLNVTKAEVSQRLLLNKMQDPLILMKNHTHNV